MSSPDEEDQEHRADRAPSADDITDPALQAEVDNPADANAPSGQEAAPGDGTTAADRGPLPAAGAPDELASDQTPSQGEERGDPAPAEPLTGAEDPSATAGGDATAVPPPPDSQAEPAPAVVAEQPPPTPSGAVSEGMAVSRAEAEKAALAERAGLAGGPAVAAAEATTEGEAPPGAADPARAALVERLRGSLGDGVVQSHIVPGVDAWVRVALEVWETAAQVCRDELGLTYFGYLSAIDWMPSPYGRSEDAGEGAGDGAEAQAGGDTADEAPGPQLEHGYAGGETRFQLLARLVSPASHLGLTLKADLDDAEPRAPTWTQVYAGADWHEREAWEMYGIDFTGHPGLRHLYLPGAFEGHPLRKDFPLLSREVKPWPGLVDVEAMPGEADAGEGAA